MCSAWMLVCDGALIIATKTRDNLANYFVKAGDPLVSGFEGCRWYLQGKPGQVYNLISGPEDSLNTLLVPANLTDDSHDNDGTFHGGLFIRHVDHYVTAFVDNVGCLEGKRDHSSFAATYRPMSELHTLSSTPGYANRTACSMQSRLMERSSQSATSRQAQSPARCTIICRSMDRPWKWLLLL